MTDEISLQSAAGEDEGAEVIDARGQRCPMPLLRTKRALAGLTAGGVIEVLSTDPASVSDIRRFTEKQGCTVYQSTLDADVMRIKILKGPTDSPLDRPQDKP